MGFWSKITKFAAEAQVQQQSYFPPPATGIAPVASGEWTLVVDADCTPVTTRPAAPGDFIARPAVPYTFGGTLPPFQNDAKLSMPQNVQALVDYECRAARNKEYLDKAMLLLSQTDDGRRLLQKAQTEKFTFVFDQTRVAEAGAVGLCDYAGKQIPLAEGRSPTEVALTLKHELQHMEDISKGLDYNSADTPKSAQMANRVLEGNARVSESIAAAEALMGSPRGPVQQFRTAALFNSFWHKNHDMAVNLRDNLHLAVKGEWAQLAANVLPGYYTNRATLDYYDKNYTDYIEKQAPDMTGHEQRAKTGSWEERQDSQKRIDYAKYTAAKLFTIDRWTPQKLADIVTIRGAQKYLSGGTFDVGSDSALETSAKSAPLFEKLKANLRHLLPEGKGAEKAQLLEMTQQKIPTIPTRTASPYAGYMTAAEKETFAAIRLPDRIDNSAGRLTTGETANSYISSRFTQQLNAMKSGSTELDRLNYTISTQLVPQNRSGNLRGAVSELAEAGLRAPMGAFPDEYLQDLYGRLRMAQGASATGDTSPVMRGELKLLDHWQEMRKKGLDPVFIDKDMKAKSAVANDTQMIFYATHLMKFLPNDSGTEGIRPQSRPALKA